jgi:tetratricopeptide (TPR) repeat protein
MNFSEDEIDRMHAVLVAETRSFVELVRIAGLDPALDLVGTDLSGVHFRQDNLAGFDFAGANLKGANLSLAKGLHPSMFYCALYDESTQWPVGFQIEGSGNSLIGSDRSLNDNQSFTEPAIVFDEVGSGTLAKQSDRLAKQCQFYEMARIIFDTADNKVGKAHCNFLLASISQLQSDFPKARQLYSEARALFQSINLPSDEASCLFGLAYVALLESNYQGAARSYKDALLLYKSCDNHIGEAGCLTRLARIAFYQHDYHKAFQLYSDAEVLYEDGGVRGGQVDCLLGLAEIALGQANYAGARRMAGKADQFAIFIDDPRSYARIRKRMSLFWSKLRKIQKGQTAGRSSTLHTSRR